MPAAQVDEPVLDAHMHFWDPVRLDYPWLDRLPALPRPFLPSDLDTEDVRLDGLVLVEAGCRPEQDEAETDWLSGLARSLDRPTRVVAAVPLERGLECAARIDELAAEPLVTGVRRLVQDEAPGFAVAAGFVAATRLLAGAGLTADLCVRSGQLAEVTALAEQCPEVSFVLDRVGKPDIATGAVHPWAGDLARLARLPNVACKLSGLTTDALPQTPRAACLPYLRHAIDCFSPARCLFGGDWPVASGTVSYSGWYETVRDAIADLDPHERAGILHDNAARTYRTDAVPAVPARAC